MSCAVAALQRRARPCKSVAARLRTMAGSLQQLLLLLALTPTKQLVATLKAPPSITPTQAGKPSIYHRAPTPYEVPEAALATLEAEGLCVVDNWAPQADVQALRRDVDKLWDAGKFIASKVGSRSVSADCLLYTSPSPRD